MDRTRFLLLICCLLAFCLAPPQAFAHSLRFAVSDILGLAQVHREWGSFADKLEEVSGIHLEFVPMRGRDDAFLSMEQQRVDLVLAGPAEYVAIRSKTNAQAVAGLSRPNYYSVIVGLDNGPIHHTTDLRGQTIALGSIGSTSAHLAPMQVLADAGLDPLRDVRIIHVDQLDASLASLHHGKIAAMAVGYSNFLNLRKASPDPQKYRILSFSPLLPGDVLMAGRHVAPEQISLLRRALDEHGTELIRAIVSAEANGKYQGMQFLVAPVASQYDYIRRMYATAGFPGFSFPEEDTAMEY